MTGTTSSATATIAANGTPESVTAALTSLNTANNNFKSHTDRVSGVTLPAAGSALPSMQQIAGVSSAVTNLKNGLQALQNDPCGQLALTMAGVLLGKDTVENALATVASLLNNIQSGIEKITRVYESVQEAITRITNIIANADAYYDEAILQLSRAATAQMAEALYNLNPCFRQIFEETIGSSNLTAKLKEAVT